MDAPEPELLPVGDGMVAVYRWPGPKGAPELHFAHANGFNALTYHELLHPLSAHLSVIASDLRGHGRTILPADPSRMKSWSIYARDLVRLLEVLGPRPRILAGHSMGAIVSLLAAEARPNLVAGLAMAEPVIMPDVVRWHSAALRTAGLFDRAMPLIAGALRRRRHFEDRETALAAYRGRGAFRTWPEAMLKGYLEGGLRSDEAGGMELACAPEWEAANFRIGPPAIWEAWRGFSRPLVVLHGSHGSTVRPITLSRLRRLNAHARFVHIPQASHFLPMEVPDTVRQEILRVLREVRL